MALVQETWLLDGPTVPRPLRVIFLRVQSTSTQAWTDTAAADVCRRSQPEAAISRRNSEFFNATVDFSELCRGARWPQSLQSDPLWRAVNELSMKYAKLMYMEQPYYTWK
jgi:hypothetical protein